MGHWAWVSSFSLSLDSRLDKGRKEREGKEVRIMRHGRAMLMGKKDEKKQEEYEVLSRNVKG